MLLTVRVTMIVLSFITIVMIIMPTISKANQNKKDAHVHNYERKVPQEGRVSHGLLTTQIEPSKSRHCRTLETLKYSARPRRSAVATEATLFTTKSISRTQEETPFCVSILKGNNRITGRSHLN